MGSQPPPPPRLSRPAPAQAQQQQLFFDLLQERERRAKDVVAAQVKGERSAAEFLKAVQQITAALVRTCPHRPLPRCQWQVPYRPVVPSDAGGWGGGRVTLPHEPYGAHCLTFFLHI